MKCKNCGAEIVRIQRMGGPVVCLASPVTYWSARDEDARELLTPNGETVYGNLTGDLQKAVGIGYLLHTCHQKPIIYKGRDNWDRPVYEDLSGRLLVDVEPRKDWKPKICTKLNNSFYGEPDCPLRFEGEFDFIPHRDTW